MKNIILIGMPGCGKTSIGKKIAKALNLDFFDCDKAIEDDTKLKISQIFEKFGEKHFRSLESLQVAQLPEKNNTVISTGGGVIENPKNIDILRKCGIVIFIDRPINDIYDDIDTATRPLLKENNLQDLYERRIQLYRYAAHISVKNIGRIENVCKKIIDEVTKNEERH